MSHVAAIDRPCPQCHAEPSQPCRAPSGREYRKTFTHAARQWKSPVIERRPDPDRRPLVSSQELSEYLGVPLATLAQWAYMGTGPRYSRVGRYRRYRWSDIERWLDAQAKGGE